ncbi:hypothetical protein FRC03_012499 [Tulasnella sp. 419]|nr:hypothetical protein FRC03_012499 [Tulasnella sp. 419]
MPLVYWVHFLGSPFGSSRSLPSSLQIRLGSLQGDLNHRKLTCDCAAPASTSFDIAIGPMANFAGAPRVISLRTIKSDVVGLDSDETAERLDREEPGW